MALLPSYNFNIVKMQTFENELLFIIQIECIIRLPFS